MSFRDTPVVSPVLVGRTQETEILYQALQATGRGRGSCILLAGEAGIGKTRLLIELRRRAAGEHFLVLQGNCFEPDVAFPYAPWIDALRLLFGRRSAEEIREVLGSLSVDFVKLLSELSSILPDIQPLPSLDPEAEKRRLFHSFAQLLTRLATPTPLLVAIEDLHWSDEISLELLHFLARRVSGYPILLVATYRSDEMPPPLTRLVAQLNRERLARELRVKPLDNEQVETMVRAILSMERPNPVDFLDLVVSSTEGNPFFVEEVLQALIEAGDIFYRDGKWQGRGHGDLHVPSTVQESVQRRAARLSAPSRQVLMICAVAGRHFDFPLLQRVTQIDESGLLQVMKELVAAQLLVEESTDRFAFRHALTRQALYATLLVRERKKLHQQIASKLEEIDAAAPVARPAELAYHYYQGEVWDKALTYCARAAERAAGLYALREAVAHLSHAIESADKLSFPVLELLHRRSQIYELLSDFERARADAELEVETARRLADVRGEWQALLDLGFLWHMRSYERAGEFLQQALDVAPRLNDPARLGATFNRVGNWLSNVDRPTEAIEYHAKALGIFEELHDQRGVAQSLELLGISCYVSADLIQGKAHCERAAQLYSQLNDPPGLLHSTMHAMLPGNSETEVTEPLDLQFLCERAESMKQMAHELGWRGGEMEVHAVMAQVLAPHGEYGRAQNAAEQVYAFATATGHRSALAISAWVSGYIYHALLAPGRAQPYLEQGLSAAREGKAQMHVHINSATLASVYISQDQLAQADSLLGAVLGEGLPARTATLRGCWTARVELALASGDSALALEIADNLIASASNIETYGRHSIPKLSLLRAEALASLSRLPEAEVELREALEVARQQARLPLVWRIHLRLAYVCHAMKRYAGTDRELASARSVVATLASKVPDEWLRAHFVRHAEELMDPLSKPSGRTALPAFGWLTARERQVAALVAQGESNRAIADELVISVKTAERHVANIMSTLGLNSRAQIAVWAAEKGLVARNP